MPIFDQGYQHWQGQLSGHGWRWLAVTRHGVRIGMKSMLIRITVILAWIPAVMLAGVMALWGLAEQKSPGAMTFLGKMIPVQEFLANPSAFRMTMWTLSFQRFLQVEIYFVMILVLMVGPSLISQDLRFNALPLYFSRPVRRIDYFVGKLGVIGFFLGLVTVVPGVIAWLLGVLFSLDFSVIFDTAHILLGVIVYGLVETLSAGLLILAMSSLTRNSRYVGALWAGFWLLTSTVSAGLHGILVSGLIIHQIKMEKGREQRSHDRLMDTAEARNDDFAPQMAPDEKARRKAARAEREQGRTEAEDKDDLEHEEQIQGLKASMEKDWRSTVSYMQNLLRIGDALLGSYEAWDDYYRLQPASQKPRSPPDGVNRRRGSPPDERLNRMQVQWPLSWSGMVLLALGGLSVWILNTRVKSLDRLR